MYFLFLFFKKKKRKKDKLTKEKSSRSIKEVNLFHGTESDAIEAIYKQGFDARLSGNRIGSKFGKGIYFAKDAIFAHHYINPINRTFKILLANVIVGEFVKGNPTYIRPPQKNPHQTGGELYDSCVDDVTDPKLFVVFCNEQTYPAYIITYTLNN